MSPFSSSCVPCLRYFLADCVRWAAAGSGRKKIPRIANGRRRFMATSEERFTGRAIEFRRLRSLYRGWQERAPPIGGNGPTVANPSNHSVKMNVRAGQDQHHVSCMIARVVKLEPNHRGLSVFMLDGLKRKVFRVGYIGLGVRCYSLRIGHDFRLMNQAQFTPGFLGRLVGLEPTTSRSTI